MNKPITSIAYLNENTFIVCLDAKKIQAWSITPTQQLDNTNNLECFQVARIDDQRFVSGSPQELTIYSFIDNQIQKISSSLDFEGLNYLQPLNSQYVVANSNNNMRIYDINQQTYDSFDCQNPNRGLFFNPNDNIMISSCEGKLISKIRLSYYKSNYLISYKQVNTNTYPTALYTVLLNNSVIKFRVVGQKVVVLDQNSLQFFNSNLSLDQQVIQKFAGFDYLRYQNDLILYDNQKNVYKFSPNNSLQWCNGLCLTCQENDPNLCLSCKYANMIVDSNFQCVCQNGFYKDSNQVCQKCSPTCKTCKDQNTCVTCDDNQFRVFNNNTQQCDCLQSYYSISMQPACIKCPYYCQTCQFNSQLNAIQCLQCFQNPEFYRSITGNCKCLPGFFDDGTNIQCVKCNYTCQQCNNQNQCSSCDNAKFRQLNSSSNCECKSGYYDDGTSQICQKCPYNCEQCQKQGAKVVCTACNTNGTFRQNDQMCSCSKGYYDSGQLTCIQCKNGCTSCDSNGQCQNNCSQNCIFCDSPTVCTKCKPLTYLVNKQCQTQCNSYEYADGTQQICIPCPNLCSKCNIDPTKCQQCTTNFVLYQGTCLASCPDGSFRDSNSTCQDCQQNCSQCDSNTTCKICKNGFYLYQNQQCLANCRDGYYNDSNNVCKSCQQNCIQCNSTICSKCQDGFYLYQNQQCLKNCPDSYYPEQSNKTCQKCMINCDQCSSSNQCKQCVQNFYLLNNIQCLADCPSQYFKDSSRSLCSLCFLNCNKCSDSSSCQQCKSGFYLLNNSLCVQKCPDGYFENRSLSFCQLCSTSSCQKCNIQNKCLECKKNYFLKETECVSECGQGFQIQNNICIACKAQNCKECDKQIDQCSSCQDKFEFLKNECVAKCQQNQIRDEKGSCFEQNQFKLEYKSNNQIQMVFKSKPEFEEIKKILQVSIPDLKDQFDYTVDVQDNFTLLITIKSSKKIDNKQTVVISINNSRDEFINPKQSIDVQIIQQKQDENPTVTKSLESATQAVSTATVAAIFPLALSGNFWMISSILDISQIIYMTSFIKFEQTSTLDTFLSSQKNFKIPFPNFFEYINHYEEIVYDTPSQINEKDIQGFYLSNMGDTISLFAIIILSYISIKLLVYMFTKYQKVQNVLIKLEKKLFPITLVADLLWVVYQDMSFSVILQLITLNIAKYVVEVLNYIIFFISFFGIVLPFYLAFIIYQGVNKEMKEHLTKDQQFKYYQILLYFRKFFYTLVIGALQTSPITQIILITIFHLTLLIIIIKLKPYRGTFSNVKEGIQSSAFFLVHLLVLSLYFIDESDSSDSKNICWVILSLFSLIIVFEIILCFREIYIAIKEVYIKQKQNKKKNLTIVPYYQKEIDEKSSKQILEENESPPIKENLTFIQDQNLGLDQSPVKLDSKQFISSLLDQNQTQIKYDLNSPVKRVLRNDKSLKEIAKTQVPENHNISNLLKIYQSQSDISVEGQTFRDFKALQSQRSTMMLIEDQNRKSNNNQVISSMREYETKNKIKQNCNDD
ncbi:hypothetical protein ABPG72_020244 [Tetrahymena utriculariae]